MDVRERRNDNMSLEKKYCICLGSPEAEPTAWFDDFDDAVGFCESKKGEGLKVFVYLGDPKDGEQCGYIKPSIEFLGAN